MITEESYTSQASFLDLDVLPSYDPKQGEDQEDKPQFSGPGIEATAVRRHLACRLNYRAVADLS